MDESQYNSTMREMSRRGHARFEAYPEELESLCQIMFPCKRIDAFLAKVKGETP